MTMIVMMMMMIIIIIIILMVVVLVRWDVDSAATAIATVSVVDTAHHVDCLAVGSGSGSGDDDVRLIVFIRWLPESICGRISDEA